MASPLGSPRRLGRSELRLTPMGLGTAHLGELFATVDEADARAALEAAWEGGVRYYDTAPWYGLGLSEHRTGGFLRTRPRDGFAVSTKVGRTLHRPPDPRVFDRGMWTGGLNFEVRFDYSRDGVLRSYEDSLQRMALDTIDALVIHDLDLSYHDAEAMARHRRDLEASGLAALEELRRAGDVRAIGMGINTGDMLETFAPALDLDFFLVAMPYTLLDQGVLGTGMAACAERGIGVVVGSPFASGILVTGSRGGGRYGYEEASEAVRAKVHGIEEVARAHDVALPAAALQFPLAHPAVAAVIPGAVGPEQVRRNLAHLAAPIPAGFWSDLRGEGLIEVDAPVPDGG